MAKTLVALIVWLCIAFPPQQHKRKPETKKPRRPAWSELTPAQQKVLAPLQPEWDQLDTTRGARNGSTIADRYPTMKPDQQQRLQKRMQEWAKLTPEERQGGAGTLPDAAEAAASEAPGSDERLGGYQTVAQQQPRAGRAATARSPIPPRAQLLPAE